MKPETWEEAMDQLMDEVHALRVALRKSQEMVSELMKVVDELDSKK